MWFMYGGDSACNVKWFLDTNYQDSWTVHDGLTLCPL